MAEFPPACHDMLHWDELLSDKEKETKYKVRKFMVRSSAALLSLECGVSLQFCALRKSAQHLVVCLQTHGVPCKTMCCEHQQCMNA